MYEGLRDGLRKATNVRLLSWIDSFPREVHLTIERNGDVVWKKVVSQSEFIEAKRADEIQENYFNAASEIVDRILDEVDWDSFFPVFTDVKTVEDIPTEDRRYEICSVTCAKVFNCTTHEPHEWMFQAEDDSPVIVLAFCPGYSEVEGA